MPALLVLLSLAALVVFTSGCDNTRIIYPGDGKLVIVDIDPALEQCPIILSAIPNVRSTQSSTVGFAIRAGIRYWDVVGVRLRTPDQLSSDEQAEAATAPHLRFFGDCSKLGTQSQNQYKPGYLLAEYHDSTGEIELYLQNWSVNYIDNKGWLWAVMKMAHESGHAIGLDHVNDPSAVMYPDNTDLNARSDLAAADVQEYRRVWGSN